MTRADAVLNQLASGLTPSARMVIVTAHPDDETVGLGGSLGLVRDGLIVQVTTGAMNDPTYETLRRHEREHAFLAAGWTVPVVECGVPDQQTHAHLESLIDALVLRLADARVVWTHPYEGGHPDHDAAAFIVQAACDRLGAAAPERLEFASYHWNGRARVAGQFFPMPDAPVVRVRIDGERLAAKQRALSAYLSQSFVKRWFDPTVECYRPAPRYDFTKAPSTPGCLYERKGWPLTSAAWRAAVAMAS